MFDSLSPKVVEWFYWETNVNLDLKALASGIDDFALFFNIPKPIKMRMSIRSLLTRPGIECKIDFPLLGLFVRAEGINSFHADVECMTRLADFLIGEHNLVYGRTEEENSKVQEFFNLQHEKRLKAPAGWSLDDDPFAEEW